MIYLENFGMFYMIFYRIDFLKADNTSLFYVVFDIKISPANTNNPL